MNQCDPERKKYQRNRGTDNQHNDTGAQNERRSGGSLAISPVEDHQRKHRHCEQEGSEEERGMMRRGSSHEERSAFKKRTPLAVPDPLEKVRQGVQVKRRRKCSRQLPCGIDQKTF